MSVGRTIEELLFALKLQQKTKFRRKIENITVKDILSDLILEVINIELFPSPAGIITSSERSSSILNTPPFTDSQKSQRMIPF